METTKKNRLAGEKFKASWKLPDGIVASSKGDQYAHCKLCKSDFSVAHGGFNDITHHARGPTHQQRFKDSNSTKHSCQLSQIFRDSPGFITLSRSPGKLLLCP